MTQLQEGSFYDQKESRGSNVNADLDADEAEHRTRLDVAA